MACYLSELRPFSDYHTQISTYSFNGPCTNLISGYLKLGYEIKSERNSFTIFLIHFIGFVMDRWGKHDWKCDLIESNSFQYLSGTYDKDILSSSLVQFATVNYLWNIICLLYTIFFFWWPLWWNDSRIWIYPAVTLNKQNTPRHARSPRLSFMSTFSKLHVHIPPNNCITKYHNVDMRLSLREGACRDTQLGKYTPGGWRGKG